jgi:iron(III) transport system substrate-binding protein
LIVFNIAIKSQKHGCEDHECQDNHEEETTMVKQQQGRITTERQPVNSKRAFCIAALTLLFGSQIVPAYAADNTGLIARAREEAKQGKFQIMVSSPKGEKAQRAVMDAFQRRFDIKVDWEWVPLTSTVSAPRLLEQSKSGVKPPSAVGGYGYTTYENWFVKNGLDVKVDWVKEFGSMLPTIKTAAVDNVLPKYHNKMLRQWDVLYVMVYNKNLVKPADVPTSISELTDPKWRGRFAMANNTPPPVDILALDMGVEGVVDLTKKLLANQPRFKPGPPAVVGAVANGEVAVGVSGYTALAEAQKQKGAPIAWVPMNILPIGPLFVFMLKDAPQPTLGKLFLAWLVTEGQKVQEQEEFLSSFSNAESATTRAIVAARPNIKIVEVRSEQDQELAERAAREVMKVVAGVAGK